MNDIFWKLFQREIWLITRDKNNRKMETNCFTTKDIYRYWKKGYNIQFRFF